MLNMPKYAAGRRVLRSSNCSNDVLLFERTFEEKKAKGRLRDMD